MADIAALAQPQPASGLPLAESSRPNQLASQACLVCGNSEQPLHRGETITTRFAADVVRDIQAMRCTTCLLAARLCRYEVAILPLTHRGRPLWGILDHRGDCAWVLNDDEVEQFPWRGGAEGWIRRQRYLDSLVPGRACTTTDPRHLHAGPETVSAPPSQGRER